MEDQRVVEEKLKEGPDMSVSPLHLLPLGSIALEPDPDEDITSMDMHEASPLDIQPIQGPITRARARQLNLEVSSFLSVPINNFKNDLLPIVYNVIRNQGEAQEMHGGRLGGVKGQQGEAKSHGGPLQLMFESNSGSRSCLR
jgi:hypothetical protein